MHFGQAGKRTSSNALLPAGKAGVRTRTFLNKGTAKKCVIYCLP